MSKAVNVNANVIVKLQLRDLSVNYLNTSPIHRESGDAKDVNWESSH